jgi:hypothetical protein
MFLDRLYIKMSVNICAAGIVFSAAGAEEPTMAKSLVEAMPTAAIAGAIDIALSEPVEYVKTMQQVKQPLSKNPRAWYSGAPVSFINMVPGLCAQIAVEKQLNQLVPGTDLEARYARASLAGVASSILITPTEMLKIHLRMQPDNAVRKSVGAMACYLMATGGARSMFRGMTTKALREGVFASGYMAMYQDLFAELQDRGIGHMPMLGFAADLPTSTIASAATAMPITLATQPIDVISTQMQRDPLGNIGKTSWQHVRALYCTDGLKGLYRGTSARCTSTAIAMLALGNVGRLKDAIWPAEGEGGSH